MEAYFGKSKMITLDGNDKNHLIFKEKFFGRFLQLEILSKGYFFDRLTLGSLKSNEEDLVLSEILKVPLNYSIKC